MPIQIADVKNVLMSTHKMNETGLKVVLDGSNIFFIDKASGRSTPIKYEHGRYDFDIWVQPPIKTCKKQKDDDDMDTSNINRVKGNRFWVLGADDQAEGF